MMQYRISKYNPEFQNERKFEEDDFTSISDVGKVYDGKMISMEDYLEEEVHYVQLLSELASEANLFPFLICDLEKYNDEKKWKESQAITLENFAELFCDCLREDVWCRLNSKQGGFVHFGYDMYVYIGCNLPSERVSATAHLNSLFCEEMISPYHE